MSEESLTPEEFKRLMEEAKERGEDTAPIVRRFAISAIEDVARQKRKEERAKPDRRDE